MTEPELKPFPCPFCGIQPEMDNTSYNDSVGHHARYSMECSNTACVIWKYYPTEKKAIEAWNTRYEK